MQSRGTCRRTYQTLVRVHRPQKNKLPYSLKFSRLKNFAVCTLTTKILSREIFSTSSSIRVRTHAL